MHLLQHGGEGILPAAVQDTVAAIARQPEYARSLRRSLVERLWRWFWDLLVRVADAIGDFRYGREISVAIVILLAALVVLRVLYAARLREDAARRRQVHRRAGGRTAMEPWSEAGQLAAEGRFTDAAHALYRGALELLERRESVRLHPSTTSGEYARLLRARRSALHEPFRAFGRRYDRLLFGHGSFGAAEYDALLADARRMAEETSRS